MRYLLILLLISLQVNALNGQEPLPPVEQPLNRLYYYDGKFGLAYEFGKYGFVDRAQRVRIPFRYDLALPFYPPGYARAQINYQHFFIDTTGTEYPVVNHIDKLYPDVMALDLSNQKLDSIPREVFD